MKKIFFIIIILIINNLNADNNFYSTRALGMGNAFISIANDSTGVNYNPAGILQDDKFNIGLNYIKFFSIESLYEFNGSIRWRNICFQYMHFQTPINISRTKLTVTYAYPIGKYVGIGINYKVNKVNYNVENYSYSDSVVLKNSTDIVMDIGLISSPLKNFSIGILVNDILLNKKNINYNLNIGLGYRLSDSSILSLDFRLKELRVGEYYSVINAGIEKYVVKNLLLRAGVYNGNITLGVGLNYKYIQLNYAFVNSTVLRTTHSFGMLITY